MLYLTFDNIKAPYGCLVKALFLIPGLLDEEHLSLCPRVLFCEAGNVFFLWKKYFLHEQHVFIIRENLRSKVLNVCSKALNVHSKVLNGGSILLNEDFP